MSQISRARELRRQSTDAERLLWSRLRDRRLMGLKFKRQYPIGRCIVDFVCKERNLVIEIDGGHHQEQRESDQSRTEWLGSRGFEVVRYWNNQVLEDIDSVLESIRMTLELETSPSIQPVTTPKRLSVRSLSPLPSWERASQQSLPRRGRDTERGVPVHPRRIT